MCYKFFYMGKISKHFPHSLCLCCFSGWLNHAGHQQSPWEPLRVQPILCHGDGEFCRSPRDSPVAGPSLSSIVFSCLTGEAHGHNHPHVHRVLPASHPADVCGAKPASESDTYESRMLNQSSVGLFISLNCGVCRTLLKLCVQNRRRAGFRMNF